MPSNLTETMNTLHSIQQKFVATVFDNNQPGFDQSIVSDGINGASRLQIYQNNIFISLRNALAAVYPVINRLVGDEFFKLLAYEYIKLFPSRSGNLHEFGKHLAQFVITFEPAEDLVYLADVARLEWAYHHVFHAANAPAFDIDKLKQVKNESYGNLIFRPNPASQLIKSPYPVLQIWQANQITQTSENKTIQDKISLDEGETMLLVIRRDLEVDFQPLTRPEYAFLDACYDNANFFEACDTTMQADPNCVIGELLLKLIQSHTLTSFTFQD